MMDGIGSTAGAGACGSFLCAALSRWAGRIAGSLAQPGNSRGTAQVALPSSFNALVAAASARHGLPEDLINAVIKAESNFDPNAVSRAGAKGLMQLMDGTARSLGVDDVFDPLQNIEGGVTYLRRMMDRFGSLPLALAAYNAGPGAVERHGGIPPFEETQRYVKRVLALAHIDCEV